MARLYRLTQEVNPAGTLITVNMVVSILVGTALNFFTLYITQNWASYSTRIAAIAILVIAVILIFPVVKTEYRAGRDSSTTDSNHFSSNEFASAKGVNLDGY